MPKGRHAVTGATRVFEGRMPGYPWIAMEEGSTLKGLSGMTKPELIAEAEAAGLDSSGTADELRELLREHREA